MQVTSILIAKADGDTLLSETVKINSLGGMEREAQMANGVVVGFKEKPIASDVECTVLHTKETKLLTLQNLKEVTLTIETDSGRKYTINKATAATPLGLDDGKSTLRFIGPAAKED